MPEVADDRKLYKIGEVCRIADVQPYALRYWETEFPALAPNKSGGGQRLYTQREIDVILRIKQLLYTEGFTIAGAKKRLEEGDAAAVAAEATGDRPQATGDEPARKALLEVKRELSAILRLLD
jgi:DNA-binding transcriptional MerR regulator